MHIASVVLSMLPRIFLLSCHYFFQRTVFQIVLTTNEALYNYFWWFFIILL